MLDSVIVTVEPRQNLSSSSEEMENCAVGFVIAILSTSDVAAHAFPSVTVSVTAYVPACEYVCSGLFPVAFSPSPKSQFQLVPPVVLSVNCTFLLESSQRCVLSAEIETVGNALTTIS